MSRVLIIALFVVVFLAGLTVLLYPVVSDFFNAREQSRAIEQYFGVVDSLSDQDYAEILEAAHEYNARLRSKKNRFNMSEEDLAEYKSLLNPTGLDVIGMLEIEIINVRLPIFHGTDQGVLQIALGHLEGSSLPVCGPGTHAVITGHRGLPSSTLLTNLDRIVLGDTFTIKVLNETLIYRVDQIVIVEPHETTALAIVAEADYCTLVTCTPYGINTHRMLVRGHRVGGETAEVFIKPAQIPSDARVLNDARAALLLVVPATIVILAVLFIRLRRVYGRGKKR